MSTKKEIDTTTSDLIEEMKSKVTNPEQLLILAKAIRLLQSREPAARKPFFRSGEFFKYLGAALGTAIAVGFLLASNVLSNAVNAITLQNAEISSSKSAIDTLKETLSQTEETLETTNQSVAQASAQFEDKKRELAEATKELDQARRQTESEKQKNSELTDEIASAKNTLAELKLRVAEEQIVGAGLFVCEKQKVVEIYNRLSHHYSLRQWHGQTKWAAMRIYLLRDGQLIYDTFVREPQDRFSSRRSETGEWTTTPDAYRLELNLGEHDQLPLEFNRGELEALLISDNSQFACATNNWCFFDNRECR